jgi:hypothetical protein
MKQRGEVRFQLRRLAGAMSILILLSGVSPRVGLPQTDRELNDLRDEIKRLHEKQDLFQKEL